MPRKLLVCMDRRRALGPGARRIFLGGMLETCVAGMAIGAEPDRRTVASSIVKTVRSNTIIGGIHDV